jgi:hypothetical protein
VLSAWQASKEPCADDYWSGIIKQTKQEGPRSYLCLLNQQEAVDEPKHADVGHKEQEDQAEGVDLESLEGALELWGTVQMADTITWAGLDG